MKRLFLALACMAGINAFAQTDASLNFDGSNDAVSMGNVDELEITGDLTVECWANLDQLGTYHFLGQGYAGIDADFANTNILYFFTINSNKTLELFMEYGSGTNMQLTSTAAAAINPGEWHHYAMVRNGTSRSVDFYVDGQKLGNTLSYGTTPDGGANSPFCIGGALRQDNTVEDPFNGSIDELRVWNVVRTQAEIQDNMNCSISSATNLLASYNFNDGMPAADNTAVTTINDNSGNGYNGTLLNFALTGTSSNFVDDVVFFSPAVNISSSDADNIINAGDAVTFTAVVGNAGSNPGFQWKKNGTNISGENGTTYVTTTLSDGDAISCEIDPSTTCYVGTVTSSAITTSVNGSLPLRLISFSAIAAKCTTTLRWTTADEQQVSGFKVEQSADGSHFEEAVTVAARNANTQNSYAVELPVTGNVMFYRLKMLDKDGKLSYSNVALVTGACSHPVSVYPNPIVNKIYISGDLGSHYAIYDNKGSRLLEGMLSKTSEVLNAQRLKPGIYFIRINGQSFKLIKQ
jgi:hypothetical protein